MSTLDTSPRLTDPDAFLAAASRRLDARLVLVLANHIGDMAVVLEALRLAREDG